MTERPARATEHVERRQFIRQSSQMAVGAVAALAADGGLRALISPQALARVSGDISASGGTKGIRGISLSGLQTDAHGKPYKTLSEMKAEIAGARHHFAATHIRLQIQQQTFVGNGHHYNRTYAKTVYDTINYARRLGLTVIINCQTEQGKVTRSYNYPNDGNRATDSFWKHMLTSAGGNFGGKSRIICDLFNEPRCGTSGRDWHRWQSSFNGLIHYIRSGLGVRDTQLWADADDYASSLAGCPGLTDPAKNLVYSFHHPSSGPGGDTAGWDRDFGHWAASHRVVNGEFAQNSKFNWGNPYKVQHYLNYCASKGIGHTIWTAVGDDYFCTSSLHPYGWWGHMIDNFWNPGNGWKTYCFRSSASWSENYIMRTGRRSPYRNGLYQGWSARERSMLAGVAGFSSFTSDMAAGTRYRMHVSFECVHADHGHMTAVVGVHGVSSPPATWAGVTPHVTNIVKLKHLKSGRWYNVDIPSSYLPRFASGHYKGIVFGPGPDSHRVYEGHVSLSPEVIIEVHA